MVYLYLETLFLLTTLSVFLAFFIHWIFSRFGNANTPKHDKKAAEALEIKKLQHQKELEMEKIHQDDRMSQRDHERVMNGQTEVFGIMKDLVSKVKETTMNEAILGSYILQSIHKGNEISETVLESLKSNVSVPIPENLKLRQEEPSKEKSIGWKDASDNGSSNHFQKPLSASADVD